MKEKPWEPLEHRINFFVLPLMSSLPGRQRAQWARDLVCTLAFPLVPVQEDCDGQHNGQLENADTMARFFDESKVQKAIKK